MQTLFYFVPECGSLGNRFFSGGRSK